MKKQDTQETQKIHEALALLNEAAHESKEDISELITSKYEALKGVLHDLEADVKGKVQHGAEYLSELKESAAERGKDAALRVDHKVHEDPWKAIGISALCAFTIGFVLGHKK
ncbi:MAG: hypothetical protein PHO37_04585 [Kiritimatiellae bacterium]|nr:hypothetical protein [Kiritimatiellia bacterium]